MLIDWFTVAAQLVNFLVLVWLMRRYLYKPILAAVDAREQKIAVTLKDAESKQSEAKKNMDEFSKKEAQFDSDRSGLMAKATQDADQERAQLSEESRKKMVVLKADQQTQLIADAKTLDRSIRQRLQNEVFTITRKLLADLASENVESRIVEIFIGKLRELPQTDKNKLIDAATPSPPLLGIRTAFEVGDEQQRVIHQAIEEILGKPVNLKFDLDPDLLSGIELSSNGQKISWSFENYMDSVETTLGGLINPKEAVAAK